MKKEIIHSSIFLKIIKKTTSFFSKVSKDSFIAYKIPYALKGELVKIQARHIGIFLGILIIIRRDIFFGCNDNYAVTLKPLFLALAVIAVLFLLCTLDLKEVYKRSVFKKMIGVSK